MRKAALLAAAFTCIGAADAKIVYVNGAIGTPGNGTTWAKSFLYLQDALEVAVAGDSVYVAKGIYYPDDGVLNGFGDRELSFVAKGIAIYGGFAGNETRIEQRDLVTNPTRLSGEIWEVTPETQGYERYWSLHVLILQGNCTLDGLTIEKGRANGDAAPFNQGGGCLMPAGSSLKAVNCTFSGNLAAESGGAISGNVVASGCTFSDNVVNNEFLFSSTLIRPHHWLFSPDCSGGAINGDVTATNCKFLNNKLTIQSLDLGTTCSATGGAISGSTVKVTDCVFDGNGVSSLSDYLDAGSNATSRGGAISATLATITNCTFANNQAVSSSSARVSPDPKAIAHYTAIPTSIGAAVAAQITAVNCSFSNNLTSTTASVGDETISNASGPALYVENASSIVNCTVTGNSSVSIDKTLDRGGRVITRGGVHITGGAVVPIANSTFVNNLTSGVGAALSCDGSVNIINNIFWYDDVVDPLLDKKAMIHVSGRARISNRLYPTPSTETINLVKGGFKAITSGAGSNIDFGEPPERTFINLDPMFVDLTDPIGPDGLWRTADDGLRLTAASPVIGKGKPLFLPADTADLDFDGDVAETIPVDTAGFARIQDGTLDLGAYELGDIIIAPDISVEQPSGTILVDGVSAIDFSTFARVPTTFTIRNVGSGGLRNLVITGTGVDITSFRFNQPAVTTLAPGGTTTFAVTFTPLAAGPRTAQLHIASNDPNESSFDIDLLGNAEVPDIAVEFPSGTGLTDDISLINYGSVGSASSSVKTFIIRNTGGADLNLLGISSSGVNAANFKVYPPAQNVLVPGASTTFNVTFRPSGTGKRNAAITIQSTDPDSESSFLFNVTGSGFGAPEIAVGEAFGPELVNGGKNGFGSVGIGLLHSKTFIVKNLGTGVLKNLAVSLSGSSRFTVTKVGVTSLNPGSQAKFTVTFKPSSIGKKTASLLITSNDADEGSLNINLSGTGVSSSSAAARSQLAAFAGFSGSPVANTRLRGVITVMKAFDESKHLVLTVDKRATRSRTVEVSSNLTDWFSGPDYTTTLLDSNAVLIVRDDAPLKQGEKRFIRLK